jgi:glutamate-1-semialdehyde 2,1-aminomutase
MTLPVPLKYARSEQLFARACEIVAGGTTQGKSPDSLIPGEYPIYAARGQGGYLWDIDGNHFLDWILAYGIIVLGYCHPAVDDAVVREIREGFAFPLTRPMQNQLAELLVEVIPCAEMVHFFKAGSDSTTAAVRLARIFTGRNKIIRWGYNGWHDWCCTKDAGIPRETRDNVLTFKYNDLDSLETVFKNNKDQVACVIMMPLEVELPHPGFLQGVKDLAHKYGALFILDEMRSGFHMALGGAQQYYNVTPDMGTFSKALSNGYAISVLAGRRDIMSCLKQTYVSSTFYTNSLEMAASVATIQELKKGVVIPHLWHLGESLQQGLRRLISQSGVEAEVVGAPPMPFMQFTYRDQGRREKAQRAFFTHTTRSGILLHPSHHWFSCASHTDADVEKTLAVCGEAFETVREIL